MEIGRAIFLSYIDGLERLGACPDTGRLYTVKRRLEDWASQKPIKIIGESND
jgi:hypothetical protein